MNTDLKICEKHIRTILKIYKVEDIEIPNDIMNDVMNKLDYFGWGCWFCDWVNHRIYAWLLEVWCENSQMEQIDFIHWEEIEESDDDK